MNCFPDYVSDRLLFSFLLNYYPRFAQYNQVHFFSTVHKHTKFSNESKLCKTIVLSRQLKRGYAVKISSK